MKTNHTFALLDPSKMAFNDPDLSNVSQILSRNKTLLAGRQGVILKRSPLIMADTCGHCCKKSVLYQLVIFS